MLQTSKKQKHIDEVFMKYETVYCQRAADSRKSACSSRRLPLWNPKKMKKKMKKKSQILKNNFQK